MASIIAGNDGVEDGFVGVAPDAQILAVKVADNTGAVDVSQVIAGIDWVVANKNSAGMNVRVLNLSYRTDSDQYYGIDPLAAAVERAWNAGIVVVVAAGNDGDNTHQLGNPAMDPFVIAVGANDENYTGAASAFSNEGDKRHPDFVAPGSKILGLIAPESRLAQANPAAFLDERFIRGSGTSQATAVASGAVALLLQDRPELTPDQVKALLILSADAIDSHGSTSASAGTDLEEFLDPALDAAAVAALQAVLDAAVARSESASASLATIEPAYDEVTAVRDDAVAEFELLIGNDPKGYEAKAKDKLAGDILKGNAPALLELEPFAAYQAAVDALAATLAVSDGSIDDVHAAHETLVSRERQLGAAEAALAAAEAPHEYAKAAEEAAADAVKVAEDALDAAQDAVDASPNGQLAAEAMVNDLADDVDDLAKDLADADKDLASAEAKLASERDRGKASKIASALAKRDSAQADRDAAAEALADAQEALDTLRLSVGTVDWAAELAAANDAVTAAEGALGVAAEVRETALAALVPLERAVEDAKAAVSAVKPSVAQAELDLIDAQSNVSSKVLKAAAYDFVVAKEAAKESDHLVKDKRNTVRKALEDVDDATQELYVERPARRAALIEDYSDSWNGRNVADVDLDEVVGSGRLNVARAAYYRTVELEQRHEPSDGSGSLEAARGSYNVVMPDGSLLQGEVTFTGSTWSGSTWSGSTWSGSTWSGSTWSGSTWSGSTWSGSTWSGSTWSGSTWSGSTWSGSTWSGSTWSGSTWSGSTWSGSTWSGSTWS
jgi:hypothetical protein